MNNTRKLVLLALLVSQALILSIVESWISVLVPVPIPVPGVKLGLANIVTLVVIIFFGFKEALIVVFIRTLLSSLFGGGIIVFLFSIAGGILSAVVMAFLYKRCLKFFSVIGISVAGAIMHNIGQIAMAVIMMKELLVLTYLPVLLISGVITGCFVGVVGNFLTDALKKTRIFEDKPR